jgi:hypothetical protein
MKEAVSCLQILVPQAIEEADLAAPKAIAEQLGNLPLALVHCASYITRRRWTFCEFATILAERRAFNELSAQLSIKEINLRFSGRTDFAGYCPMFHWSDFSKPAASMGPTLFETGFKIASRLLMKVWPSRRKLPNILRTNWPEFDALHNHVWKLASAYRDRRVI